MQRAMRCDVMRFLRCVVSVGRCWKRQAIRWIITGAHALYRGKQIEYVCVYVSSWDICDVYMSFRCVALNSAHVASLIYRDRIASALSDRAALSSRCRQRD